jgi:broad specificity phosphatase PhoE
MRVTLVRHYKTVNNEARRIMGWGDAPRAEDWEPDLLHVAAAIKKRGIRFDACYSSALGRARETMRYLAAKCGCSEMLAAPELNEVNYGDLFQRPKQWAAEHYPGYKTDADFVFPGGESFRQMQRRSVDFLLSLQQAHADHSLLLVVHAGVIRGLVSYFLGLDLTANLKRKVSHRYAGELVIDNDICVFYDELGKPSGFARDGVVEIPYGTRPVGTSRIVRATAVAAFPKRDVDPRRVLPAAGAASK